MRPSLGRVTLRGASRLVAAPTAPRSAAVPGRRAPAPRELCTSSAIASDQKRKLEDAEADPDRVAAGAISDPKGPSVEVITEDVTIPAVEPLIGGETANAAAAPTPFEPSAPASELTAEQTSAEAEDVKYGPIESTPEELSTQLKEYFSKNAIRTALWHFTRALRQDGSPAVDEAVCKMMLPVLGRNSWGPTSLQTLMLAADRDYDLGVGIYNCGLHAISRSGAYDKVNEIITKMWTLPRASAPNATTYNYLISAFVYRGKIDEAFNVLQDMKSHLIYPTFSTYHGLITGCLRRRDPRRAYNTLLAVEKQRFDMNAMTIAQVLVASANNDDYNNVLELLDKFEDTLPQYASEVHRIAEDRSLYRLNDTEWTSKDDRAKVRGDPKLEIGAISTVLHSAFRGARVDIAIRAWTLLENLYPEYEIPKPFWYCLIGTLAGAGEFSRAIDIVGYMREQGMKPMLRDLEMTLIRPLSFDVAVIDEQFFRLCDRADGKDTTIAPVVEEKSTSEAATEATKDAAVTSAVPEGDAATEADGTAIEAGEDSAKTLGDEPVDTDPAVKELSTEEVTEKTDATEEGTEKTDDAEEGIEKTDEAGEETETADSASTSLGDILAKAPVAQLQFSVIDKFKPTTVGIDELNVIVGACSAGNDLDRAFQTYDEVESRFGFEKTEDTYNALLDGCVQIRHLRGGLRIIQEMENVGMQIGPRTVHLASRLLLRNGRGKDVTSLIVKAREDDVQVLMQTYQMVIRFLIRGDKVDEAVKFIEMGEAQGHNYNGLTARLDFTGVRKLPRREGDNRVPLDARTDLDEHNAARGERNGASAGQHVESQAADTDVDTDAHEANAGQGVDGEKGIPDGSISEGSPGSLSSIAK